MYALSIDQADTVYSWWKYGLYNGHNHCAQFFKHTNMQMQLLCANSGIR